jgi:putative transposase
VESLPPGTAGIPAGGLNGTKKQPAGKDAGAPRKARAYCHAMKPLTKSSPSLTPSFSLASKETGRVMTSVKSPEPHLGWHSRGYLPHWDHPGMIQSLNFRLADSLPRIVVKKWQDELELSSQLESQRVIELRRRIEEYLDSGYGECWLKLPEIAQLIETAMLHFDSERYRLLAWCVMPNHVHALIEIKEGFPMPKVLHSWKSYTATQANKRLGRCGDFWQREYLDRFVRNAEHYQTVVSYIEANPIKAGLAEVKTEWPWSSARFRSLLGAPASLPASE